MNLMIIFVAVVPPASAAAISLRLISTGKLTSKRSCPLGVNFDFGERALGGLRPCSPASKFGAPAPGRAVAKRPGTQYILVISRD